MDDTLGVDNLHCDLNAADAWRDKSDYGCPGDKYKAPDKYLVSCAGLDPYSFSNGDKSIPDDDVDLSLEREAYFTDDVDYVGDAYDAPNEHLGSTSGWDTHSDSSDGLVLFLNSNISGAKTWRSGLRVDSQTSSCKHLVLDFHSVESDFGSCFDQDSFSKGRGSILAD